MFKVMICGRITKELELKEVNEKKVCNFSLATRCSNGETAFIQCSIWNQQAENLVKYIEKGQQLTILGNGELKAYQDEAYKTALHVHVYEVEYGAKVNKAE